MVSQLHLLDLAKIPYLKYVSVLHHAARNKLIYLLANMPPLIGDPRLPFRLLPSKAFFRYRKKMGKQSAEIHVEVRNTTTMQNNEWQESSRVNHYIVVYFALHSLHWKLPQGSLRPTKVYVDVYPDKYRGVQLSFAVLSVASDTL